MKPPGFIQTIFGIISTIISLAFFFLPFYDPYAKKANIDNEDRLIFVFTGIIVLTVGLMLLFFGLKKLYLNNISINRNVESKSTTNQPQVPIIKTNAKNTNETTSKKYCNKCGAEVSGCSYCSSCGNKVE